MNQSTESWGLDEVQVSVLDAPVADEIELVEHWQVMHGGDPEKANSALWAILAQGKAGIDFALDRVGEGAAEQGKLAKQRREKLAKDYASAVSDLTSDQFIERVEATQALLKMGTSIRPLLEKQLRGKVDPQAKVLLKSILKKFGDVPAAGEAPGLEAMARSRVKHLLRVANTPETKAALAEMLAVDQDTGLAHDEVVLAAEDAKLKGPGWGFELDAERGCWTNWYLVSNALYWFPALPAGEFEVVLDLATGDGVGGDEFEVLVAGQVLEGKVPQLEDGAEDEFREVSVGKVLVTNSGKEVIYVRSKGSRGPWLMDLKKMRLVPVE